MEYTVVTRVALLYGCFTGVKCLRKNSVILRNNATWKELRELITVLLSVDYCIVC